MYVFLRAIPERSFYVLKTLRNLYHDDYSETVEHALDAYAKAVGLNPDNLVQSRKDLRFNAGMKPSLKDISTEDLVKKLTPAPKRKSANSTTTTPSGEQEPPKDTQENSGSFKNSGNLENSGSLGNSGSSENSGNIPAQPTSHEE